MKLIIGSHNLHKIREYKAILKALGGFDILSLLDFPEYKSTPETGKTFEENALAKAQHAAQALGACVIADDSGLVVPALSNAPGIYSARYAGENATDKDNRAKLIKALSEISEEDRAGYFYCAIAIVSPDGTEKCVAGRCEGTLLLEERGSQGFGYDPLFVKYDYNQTFAEIPEETKNRISHRRKAFDKMLPYLEALLSAHTAS